MKRSHEGLPIGLQLRLLPQTYRVCGVVGVPRMAWDAVGLELAHQRASKVFKLTGNIPHAHLLMIWVREDRRGEGLSSRLVRAITDQGDRLGYGAYLEADGAFNSLYIYHTLGFVPSGKGQIGIWDSDTVVYTSMLRLPQKPDHNRLARGYQDPRDSEPEHGHTRCEGCSGNCACHGGDDSCVGGGCH